jgi:hypothetical protein
MRQIRIAMTAVCLTAVLAFIGSAAAMPTGPDLTTKAGVERYLKSLGVDPAGVVVQRGARNYAGPNCPGRGWRCTQAARVLQLGTVNFFVCEPGSGSEDRGFQTCTIVQPGPNSVNNARCVQRTSEVPARQHCSITQRGTRNTAQIIQEATQETGTDQPAIQTGVLMQTGSQSNLASVTQHVFQEILSGETQTQNAHQVADVTQTGSAAAPNRLTLRQTQFQRALDGVTQLQNAGPFPGELADCGNEPFGPTEPNICAKVTQTSVRGANVVAFKQRSDQTARTEALAFQQQNRFNGGLDGDVHQATSTGSSNLEAEQDKTQRQVGAAGSSQTQFDPTACCGISSQQGGTGNAETIDQSVDQFASEDTGASQQIQIFGTSNTQGSCSITHHASTNIDSSDETAAREPPCGILILETVCTSDVGEPSVEQEPGCFTRVVPPPDGGEG